MNEFRGIVLYDMQLDGNLNGVYTNDHRELSGRILTETARVKLNSEPFEGMDGTFEYDAVYIDVDNTFVNCDLTLIVRNRIIKAEWRLQNQTGIIFRGEGFVMNDRQIALSYWFTANS